MIICIILFTFARASLASLEVQGHLFPSLCQQSNNLDYILLSIFIWINALGIQIHA